jgi:uncharacterized RDD family membrane protein YckC
VSLPPPLPPSNPYAAPAARVEDFQQEQLVLADRVIRLVAKIVDGLIMGAVGVVVVLAAVGLPELSGNTETRGIITGVAVLIGVGAFVAVGVYNLILLHRHGQTIAKRMFGIRIVRSDGSPCDLLRIIFARWLPVTLISMIPLIGGIMSLVDPLMIFRDDQRCLHDLIADTIVVKI